METIICNDPQDLGKQSGDYAIKQLQGLTTEQDEVNIILATGASQFETLKVLATGNDIDWSKVNMFHLDEYIGIDNTHPASFCKYLQERFVSLVPTLKAVHLIDPNDFDSPQACCDHFGAIISQVDIDIALVGIGENGHMAFNDPPADFETKDAYIVVDLDEPCRKQQMGEGWFATLDDVPKQAISMSINEVMRAKEIVCSVPDARKAQAVKDTVENDINPNYPSTIIKNHSACKLYLDKESASLLSQ
ncbi:MAG: glucosamine-6-phosphate deaminase [Lentisphaeria bacterium]|nr:glucosamine-6-phosphate deaminase [Lentisphaeria bacterium]NQZ70146.1 glucosamine-6-phosphate deaminase [Lentisphaeria bacterium]